MRIKRYFAQEIRQAIAQVREELGPDAVILSTRRTGGGVELVAATDYDEAALERELAPAAKAQARSAGAPPAAAAGGDAQASPGADPAATGAGAKEPRVVWAQDPAIVQMREEIQALRGLIEEGLSRLAWGELGRRAPRRVELLRRLAALGLAPEVAAAVAEQVGKDADGERAWRQALAALARMLPVAADDLLDEGGIVALVGPTGVGKTTTVAKLAARFALRHGQRSVALVSTDGYRVGAHDQLLTYGRLLGVPVQPAASREELGRVLQGLLDRRLVLIDTAGMGPRDLRLSEALGALAGVPMVRRYLVLSAAAHPGALEEAVRAFAPAGLDGCVLTKLDEAGTLGEALSVTIRHRLPVAWLTDGQRVPEDLQPARAHVLVSKTVAAARGSRADEDALAASLGRMAAHAGW